MHKLKIVKNTPKHIEHTQGAPKGRPQKKGHKKPPSLSTKPHLIYKIKQRH